MWRAISVCAYRSGDGHDLTKRQLDVACPRRHVQDVGPGRYCSPRHPTYIEPLSRAHKAGAHIAIHREFEGRAFAAEIDQSILTVATSPAGMSSSYFDQSARGILTRSAGDLALVFKCK
jgi:hypothetical protein